MGWPAPSGQLPRTVDRGNLEQARQCGDLGRPYLTKKGLCFVLATKGGADSNPAWYHNLRANPDTTIEVGAEKIAVRAVELRGPERDRVYARQAELHPGFGDYQRGTSRVIPVMALKPVR